MSDALNELKNRGNTCFGEGKVNEAIRCYEEALNSSTDPALAAQRSVVASNLSHALWTVGQFDKSVEAAKVATTEDPSNVKGWLRLLRSLDSSQRFMEGLIVYRGDGRHVLLDSKDRSVAELAGNVISNIHTKLGLEDVVDNFAVQALSNNSGLTSFSSTAFPAQKVLFIEQQWAHRLLQPLLSSDSDGGCVSAERLITHFGRQLRAIQEQADPKAWNEVRLAMCGSWPRSIEDVPQEQRVSSERLLADLFSSDEHKPTTAELEQLVRLSLVCRYNCFQMGFFRTCALINHSCSPNVAMKFVQRTQSVHLLSVQPIRKGETLSVKYLSDADYLEGVGRRRQLLHSSWLFWCDCARCTEDITPSTSSTVPSSPSSSSCRGHSELKKCKVCENGYVHCPAPGRVEADTDVDPDIATYTAVCACGAKCSWDTEEVATLYRVRDDAVKALTAPALRLDYLSVRFMECRAKVGSLVHPEHWMHRVLLYYYSLPVAQQVGQVFMPLLQGEDGALAAIGPEFLRQFGIPDQGDRNGGDALACLRQLWKLIEPFYPWGEGWALHCAICRLVLFSLCLPETPMSMEPANATEVLALHAPHVGHQERMAYNHFLIKWKPIGPHAIPQKIMKSIKKALEG